MEVLIHDYLTQFVGIMLQNMHLEIHLWKNMNYGLNEQQVLVCHMWSKFWSSSNSTHVNFWAIIGGYWLDTSNNWLLSALNFEATCSKATLNQPSYQTFFWKLVASNFRTNYGQNILGFHLQWLCLRILDELIKCNSLSCQNKNSHPTLESD